MFIDNLDSGDLLTDRTVAEVIQQLILLCGDYNIADVVIRADRHPNWEYELRIE